MNCYQQKEFNMRYRIGIDLGTNSLGWAAIELLADVHGALGAGPLIDMGSRIFSDARNPQDLSLIHI